MEAACAHRGVAAFGSGFERSGAMTPLPGVRRELDDIGALMPGIVRYDTDFTGVALREALDSSFPVVHIASHFVLQPGNVLQSYLALGDGSTLTLRDVAVDGYRFDGIDLLTLSACNTATPDSGSNGREMEGFGGTLQRLGARSVIATLWPVADRVTPRIMRSLYAERVDRPATSKAELLRHAQLAALRGNDVDGAMLTHALAERSALRAHADAARFTPPASAPFAHPYYWAAFVLIGNWR